MEIELEAGRDAEVRASAAQAPEQLGLLVRRRPDQAPVGGRELHGPQAVDREPEPALEPADAATERQSGDTRVTDDPHRADEAVLLGRDVELTQQRSAGGASATPLRVDADGVHPAEVDDQPALGRRVADGTVTAGADGDLEVPITTEADGSDDVLDVRGSEDQGRPPIEHRVPDPPGIVVVAGIGRDDPACEGAAELVHLGAGRRVATRKRHGTELDRVAAAHAGRAVRHDGRDHAEDVVVGIEEVADTADALHVHGRKRHVAAERDTATH